MTTKTKAKTDPVAKLFRSQLRAGEVLAIEPQAIDFSYLYTGVPATEYLEGGIAVVTIHGPLEHHATEEWDSYESILNRVEAAMSGEEQMAQWVLSDTEDPPPITQKSRAVVLRIDSPGGEAAGATWAHRKLQKLRKKYDVPLYAYANEMVCSAAYELACAADELWLPDTGQVGSIGVIATMYDRTKHNEKTGLAIELITSGERKADNHADRPLTDDIRDRMKDRVMSLANVFWGVVADSRGLSVQNVSDLEAGVFTGQDAVDAGIADGVCGWDRFLKYVSQSLDNPDELNG